jgi:PIN domain nuclease of toxin-antitoxin system
MLIFILFGQEYNISRDVASLIDDTASLLCTSSVAVQELLLLHRIGKLETRLHKTEDDILDALEKANIEICYFNKHHMRQYAKLEIVPSHKDMNDHAIIAQAISDKITLLSSDHAFKHYEKQGLKFVFNRR